MFIYGRRRRNWTPASFRQPPVFQTGVRTILLHLLKIAKAGEVSVGDAQHHQLPILRLLSLP